VYVGYNLYRRVVSRKHGERFGIDVRVSLTIRNIVGWRFFLVEEGVYYKFFVTTASNYQFCRCSENEKRFAPFGWTEKQEQNIFTLIASALHASRHCQARRTLRQYDHLIADAQMPIRHELSQNSGDQKPPVTRVRTH
jgi:hypothetical protein